MTSQEYKKSKVGDKVTLVKGLVLHNMYGGLEFFPGMSFTGTRIIRQKESGDICLSSGFWYTKSILNIVKE